MLQAKEILIERRDTHRDSLVDKLRDERVKSVIEPILIGEMAGGEVMAKKQLKNPTINMYNVSLSCHKKIGDIASATAKPSQNPLNRESGLMVTYQIEEKYLLSIAHAFYSNRFHMLTLTEVVRLQVKPDEDGLLKLPPEMDREIKKQAFDFLLAMFPPETHGLLEGEREKWTTPQ